jgi:hypothetical protein
VLKPKSLFTIFDILRIADGAIRYPVPWAVSEESSFVVSPKEYRDALRNAGFEIARQTGRAAFGIAFTERIVARMQQGGPPALGLHLLMGEKTPLMIKNVLVMMKEGVLEPVEIFARAA